MLEKFHGYFASIDMTKPLIDKVEELCASYSNLIGVEMSAAFVTDRYEPEGARRYDSLWLVTPRLLIEAKQFVTASQMDFMPADGGVSWVEIIRSDLRDFKESTRATTLQVNVQFKYPTHGQLHAANNNCLNLYNFASEYFHPYLPTR